MRWNLLNLADSAAMHGSSLKYAWLSDGTLAWVSYYRDCWFAGDHLGNVRTVIDITPGLPAPQILEQNDYLPFGTRIQDADLTSVMDNRWRYAGKEAQRFGTLDLDLLNFGARMYDPFTARWTAVDPLAKSLLPYSPFLYCTGNPIVRKDPDGLFPETVWDAASLVMGVKSFVSNVKQGKAGAAILDGVGIVADAFAVATPFVPGGVGAGIKAIRAGDKIADVIKGADKASDASKGIIVASKNADNTANAAKNVARTTESAKGESKIIVSAENKIDRSILNAPDKPGNAPTFKSDGTKVEIHHIGQNPQGPFKEMHWTDHRGKGHYKENHSKTNSSIDRKQFDTQKKEYWKNEYRQNN